MNTRRARALRPTAVRIIEQREQAVRDYELRSRIHARGGRYPHMPYNPDTKHVQDPAWRIYKRKSLRAFDDLCAMYDERAQRRLDALRQKRA